MELDGVLDHQHLIGVLSLTDYLQLHYKLQVGHLDNLRMNTLDAKVAIIIEYK